MNLSLNFLETIPHRVVIGYGPAHDNIFLIGPLIRLIFFIVPRPLPTPYGNDITGSSILLYLPPVDHAPVLPTPLPFKYI